MGNIILGLFILVITMLLVELIKTVEDNRDDGDENDFMVKPHD